MCRAVGHSVPNSRLRESVTEEVYCVTESGVVSGVH